MDALVITMLHACRPMSSAARLGRPIREKDGRCVLGEGALPSVRPSVAEDEKEKQKEGMRKGERDKAKKKKADNNGSERESKDDSHADAQCSDCKLYTPTWSDYKTCPKDTLKCFSAEVRVLVTEWERSEGDVLKNLERGLKFLEDGPHNQNQSACGPCELHPEENVQHFLRELKRILERINSAFSAIA
nr:interleukin 15, like isoform X2 [Syngnathus scovelli]